MIVVINQPIHRLIDRPSSHSLSPSLPSDRRVNRTFRNAHKPSSINTLERVNEPILILHSQRIIHNRLHRAPHRQIIGIPVYPSHTPPSSALFSCICVLIISKGCVKKVAEMPAMMPVRRLRSVIGVLYASWSDIMEGLMVW